LDLHYQAILSTPFLDLLSWEMIVYSEENDLRGSASFFAPESLNESFFAPLKGFSTSGFSHSSTPYSPQIHNLKYFLILFWICGNIIFKICAPGFDTPQIFVPQGLIPRRTLLGGVSGPAGRCSAGYQTLQNKRLL
jgi:hypothetical protein